MKYA
jgi:D-2-hydroxyglutarate dehydrogenase